MGLFKDAKDLETVFDAFMKEVLVHPLIAPKLARSKMIVQFQYTDPDTQITINFKEPQKESQKESQKEFQKEFQKDSKLAGTIIWGAVDCEPDVIFKQSADFSNRFWQGKENVIAALAKRQVTARGSITKALQLIPVIRPSFRIYPKVLEKLGRSYLIVD
jgi:putative sterol carrier protein